MTCDEIKALAELPHGEAKKILREKVDPAWGEPVPEGETLFKVEVTQTVVETTTRTGYVILSAKSAREAQSLAEDHEDIKWDVEDVDEEEDWDIGAVSEV